MVPRGHSKFGWPAGGKLFVHGWPVASVKRLQHPVLLPRRGGKMPMLRGTRLVSIRDGVFEDENKSQKPPELKPKSLHRATKKATAKQRPGTKIGQLSSKSPAAAWGKRAATAPPAAPTVPPPAGAVDEVECNDDDGCVISTTVTLFRANPFLTPFDLLLLTSPWLR